MLTSHLTSIPQACAVFCFAFFPPLLFSKVFFLAGWQSRSSSFTSPSRLSQRVSIASYTSLSPIAMHLPPVIIGKRQPLFEKTKLRKRKKKKKLYTANMKQSKQSSLKQFRGIGFPALNPRLDYTWLKFPTISILYGLDGPSELVAQRL